MENKFTVYILYSEMINKYYVGYTSRVLGEYMKLPTEKVVWLFSIRHKV